MLPIRFHMRNDHASRLLSARVSRIHPLQVAEYGPRPGDRLYDRHLNCSVSAIRFDRDSPLESLVCQRTKPEAA
jgi:hypothetical protein